MRATLQTLFDRSGERKYICTPEQLRFLAALQGEDTETAVFCRLLVFTGCRISEALAITPARLDTDLCCVIFRTLKRRGVAYRAVPVPLDLLTALYGLATSIPEDARIFRWCRQTAWRRVKRVMKSAAIAGSHATPRGLRHGFGVANAEHGVPMATTQKWLGHASLETTAIYQQAVGREEHAPAQRLWRNWQVS